MLLIRGGTLIDPKSKTCGPRDLVIDGERIVSVYTPRAENGAQNNDTPMAGKPSAFDKVIDAEGKIIIPGLVDVHVHFREPGLTYKEDIASGSAAAARGGYTTVVCMANTRPPVDTPETLALVLEKAAAAPIHVHTLAALTRSLKGRELCDLALLQKLGAAGFSDDGMPVMDAGILRDALFKTRELDALISLHEEDPALIHDPGVNSGEAAAGLGLLGAPPVSEYSMIARDCMLALAAQARLHIQHVSSAFSAEIIRTAKKLGARLSAEVTPQHLALSEDALYAKGTLAKLNPPFRSAFDRAALIRALQDGTIDIIATDHAPHSAEEKNLPFAKAPSGVIGLETALGVCRTTLVDQGHLDLMTLIEKMSLAPAKLYGFDAGYIAAGGPADLALIDRDRRWVVSDFASKSSNSPFTGETLSGKVLLTLCRGRIVYRDSDSGYTIP
ncbi:MAG: dihydroorotase [Spirochaetaceae bacterium]|jgi:dihydroorotase|nr:dihydroorotase [Spirochaetaceae bacterium]